ncbi:bola [Pyrrhoderma noxium]|uniref:Bola n=1 Tax=Pyrrhoderma noxium TaxID=2282107 RepID=A0A286UUP4_9AGAM|nr:bola [Pyrrhoderma noxium]
MPVSAESIEIALRESIPITHLEVTDQSNGCGENYAVFIVSEIFVGKLPLARHRLINELLKDQISQMHAFSQKHMTPKQYEAKLAAELGT